MVSAAPATFLTGWLERAEDPGIHARIWCALPIMDWLVARTGACAMTRADIAQALDDAGNLLGAMRRCAGRLGLVRTDVAEPGDIAVVRHDDRGHVLALVVRGGPAPVCAIATADLILVCEPFPVAGLWKIA